MPTDEVKSHSDGAKEIVEHCRRIARAAMSDTETWLQQDAFSRSIPEALSDAILMTDETGIILSANRQFELMFGYHRSDIIGRRPEMLLSDASQANRIKLRKAYPQPAGLRERSQELKVKARRKNGVEIDVLISLGPVVSPAGVYTIIVIRRVRD
jgi:PAS domain S-box-containing protein